jgi:hypothetical protein
VEKEKEKEKGNKKGKTTKRIEKELLQEREKKAVVSAYLVYKLDTRC